jgi:hypothetical protein
MEIGARPRFFSHIMIGTRLAHYEITNHLGSGGMGDVYQATDTKLGRSVAIKFLPEAFSHASERVSRFQREARVLASLNHPGIAAIHGLEEINSRHFLVMELVAGETLGRENQARLDSDRRSAGDREADCGSIGRGARERCGASGSEAGEHQGDARRQSEGARFRAREGLRTRAGGRSGFEFTDDQHGGNERGADSRNGGLHVAGAGAREDIGPAHRHMGAGLCLV